MDYASLITRLQHCTYMEGQEKTEITKLEEEEWAALTTNNFEVGRSGKAN